MSDIRVSLEPTNDGKSVIIIVTNTTQILNSIELFNALHELMAKIVEIESDEGKPDVQN